ncbi:KRAB-A domain-containing protein 2 [Trichonephila clavipes]|nr:KRAB-A domain-containing protein 2 [Trichonephila clavipes]
MTNIETEDQPEEIANTFETEEKLKETGNTSEKNLISGHTESQIPKKTEIGDTERIQVPDDDSDRTDNRNMLAVVVGIEDSNFNKIANENGTLKQLYTRNQFIFCKEKLLSIDEICFQEMSLRGAAAANSKSGGQDYTRCHCKRKCSIQINAVVQARASCEIQNIIIV